MPVPLSAQPYDTILGISKSKSSVGSNRIVGTNNDVDANNDDEDGIIIGNDNVGPTGHYVTADPSIDKNNDRIGCQQNCTTNDVILPETANQSLYTPRYILGLFFILLQCIVWIGGAVLTQYLYKTFHFHSPFIMTYIGMSLLSLYIPIQYITIQITKYFSKEKNDQQYTPDILQPSSSTCTFDIQIQNANTCSNYIYISTTGTKNYLNNTTSHEDTINNDNNEYNITTNYHDMNTADHNNTNYDTFRNRNIDIDNNDHNQQQQYYVKNNKTLHKKIIKNWNHKKHMIAAIILCPSMFLADYLFNNALYYTSIASATVLVSTQCIFVFILASCICHLETYSLCKMIGVLISFIGTSLTAIKDQQNSDDNDNMDNNNPFIGDMIAVLAAILYAIYTIQVRIYCPQNEDLYSMQILLGYIGLLCFILLLPIAIYIIVTNYKQFIIFNDNNDDNTTNNNNNHYHMTILLIVVLFSKGFMDFLITDYCLFRSIILTNPTVATVGLGMTIPMAFLSDYIFSIGPSSTSTTSTAERFYSIMGAIAVTIGFLIVNLAPEKQQ